MLERFAHALRMARRIFGQSRDPSVGAARLPTYLRPHCCLLEVQAIASLARPPGMFLCQPLFGPQPRILCGVNQGKATLKRNNSVICLPLLAALTACGGYTPETGLVVAPLAADVAPGDTLHFSAQPEAVWSVQEAGGGSIDASGNYTAPALEGTFHVVASGKTVRVASVSSEVRVRRRIAVSVSPAAISLAATQLATFSATVTGTTNTAVTWSVAESSACGSITQGGVYTAPATAGTCHVVVASVANPSKTATAPVTVTAGAPPPPPPAVVAVSVSPETASVAAGQTATFAATVTGTTNTAVTWSVAEGAACGSITQGGVYAAPASAGTCHVAATSVANPTKSASATVTVTAAPPPPPAAVAVSVSPATASVAAGRTATFADTVTGTTNTAVTWSVAEGAACGTITQGGGYTAPASAGTCHVAAASVADPTKTAMATVTVTAPPPPPVVAVSVSPATASVAAGQTAMFAATVTGTTNTAVTWSVAEGAAGGSIGADGRYTAPGAAGTYHVVATSSADSSKTAAATVTVTAPVPVVAVSVAPASASIAVSGTLQLTATVTGSTNTAVTWAVREGAAGGSVSASGLYTAPATAGTYHVVATSNADATRNATATLTVTAPVDPTLRTVQGWQSLFDQSWNSENSYYLPKTQSAHSFDHYNAAYGLDGLTAMFEASGSTKYLDQALLYVNNVIATAVVSSSLSTSQFKDSYMAWPAYDDEGNHDEQALYESYWWRYVTKLLRAVHDNAAVYATPTYKAQYDTILAFAKKNLWQKWHSRGDNGWIYRETTYMAAHWAFICLDLWALTPDPTERATYKAVVDNINLHLPNYPGDSIRGQLILQGTRYFWNDFFGSSATPGSESDHGNGLISYLVEAHDRGVEWTDADMSAFSQTLLQKLWPSPGVYYTYVDGTSAGDGWFTDGYIKLGRYDTTIQKRVENATIGLGFQHYGNGALNAKILNGG